MIISHRKYLRFLRMLWSTDQNNIIALIGSTGIIGITFIKLISAVKTLKGGEEDHSWHKEVRYGFNFTSYKAATDTPLLGGIPYMQCFVSLPWSRVGGFTMGEFLQWGSFGLCVEWGSCLNEPTRTSYMDTFQTEESGLWILRALPQGWDGVTWALFSDHHFGAVSLRHWQPQRAEILYGWINSTWIAGFLFASALLLDGLRAGGGEGIRYKVCPWCIFPDIISSSPTDSDSSISAYLQVQYLTLHFYKAQASLIFDNEGLFHLHGHGHLCRSFPRSPCRGRNPRTQPIRRSQIRRRPSW